MSSAAKLAEARIAEIEEQKKKQIQEIEAECASQLRTTTHSHTERLKSLASELRRQDAVTQVLLRCC